MKTFEHVYPRLSVVLILIGALTMACSMRDINTEPDKRQLRKMAAEKAKAEEEKAKAEMEKAKTAAENAIPAHNNLHSTLWVQTAAEYDALTRQAYAAAQVSLLAGLKDRKWTAAPVEQTEKFSNLPPAVILDIDETVLDNSPYQARLVAEGGSFNPDTWAEWCKEERAKAVPGALEFIQFAASKGVKVFYVSNRDASLEEATRNNLKALGFPIDEDIDVVLLKKEEDNWGSKKGTRRTVVAQQFRVVMMFGDNLGDFTDDYKTSRAARDQVVEDNKSYWGERWIMLPNPTYGSWQGAIFDFNAPKDARDRVEGKFDALQK